MNYSRKVVLAIMQGWVGKKESDGTHKSIIDTYNSQKPLPVGYKVKYTDAWCATTVSAAFYKAGYGDIFPLECSCIRMVAKAKEMGIWQELDSYIPKPGDCILYDWQDSGVGDNTGSPDHVGMVESVNNGVMIIIEGNYKDAVTRRIISINSKYIRGFVTPKFDDDGADISTPSDENKTTKTVTSKKATESASSRDTAYSGEYIVLADALNIRNGAGKNKAILGTLSKNTKVLCYGYYTKVLGTPWLYCQAKEGDITYTGFCSGTYLKLTKKI